MNTEQYEKFVDIIDNFNNQLEDIITQHEDNEIVEQILNQIQGRTQDFVYELESDVEKMEMIELVA